MADLADRTVLVTGASRGIGAAIAVRAARDGARVALLGKTTRPHPKLPGTLGETARAVEAAGGRALVLRCDVRDADAVEAAVAATVDAFGRLDVVVHNAGAIHLAGTADTPVRRWDLMHQVNARAMFVLVRASLEPLARSDRAHVVAMCPPLDVSPRWLAPHVAYTVSKYAMSLMVVGMAEELRERRIAVNGLWPRTTIDTAAVRNLLGGEAMARRSRRPEIVADAFHALVTRDPAACTGALRIDEDVLREAGVSDFDAYAVDPTADLQPDLFVD